MDQFYINGGRHLEGELELYSAKNALLPILAGAILCEEDVLIKNCCSFSDVIYMVKILENLGVKAEFSGNDLHLNLKDADNYKVTEEHTKKVRSSIFMLGSLLSRFKYAKVSYPGGCNIGTRPIDIHLKGLKTLNVKIEEVDGFINCDGTNMKSGIVVFDFPSVGATENIMMASVFLNGTTYIHNAAREPEIIDLQNFLNSMGAKVKGAGSYIIEIEGVEKFHYTEYKPISDRIVAGTYLIGAAITKGNITLKNTNPEHNGALIKLLKQIGCKISLKPSSITISNKKRLKNIKHLETRPYPGFATDLQNQFLALETIGKGTGFITENLYETRFKIIPELLKMGASITVKDRTAVVQGVERLYGANVTAPDLRSGAGLILAGLCAEGVTQVGDIENVERGYLNIETDLAKLNADIKRINSH